MLQAAQSLGATEILITDLVQERLNVAKELGATHTLLLGRDDKAEDITARIQKIMSESPDRSIDCCGAESSTRLAIYVSAAQYARFLIIPILYNYIYDRLRVLEELLS